MQLCGLHGHDQPAATTRRLCSGKAIQNGKTCMGGQAGAVQQEAGSAERGQWQGIVVVQHLATSPWRHSKIQCCCGPPSSPAPCVHACCIAWLACHLSLKPLVQPLVATSRQAHLTAAAHKPTTGATCSSCCGRTANPGTLVCRAVGLDASDVVVVIIVTSLQQTEGPSNRATFTPLQQIAPPLLPPPWVV